MFGRLLYMLASMQKAFSNSETPIWKGPNLVIITLVALRLIQCMPCKEMHGRYRSVHNYCAIDCNRHSPTE